MKLLNGLVTKTVAHWQVASMCITPMQSSSAEKTVRIARSCLHKSCPGYKAGLGKMSRKMGICGGEPGLRQEVRGHQSQTNGALLPLRNLKGVREEYLKSSAGSVAMKKTALQNFTIVQKSGM